MRALLNDDVRVCVCNRPAFGRFVLNGKFTAPAENEKDASWELYMHVEEQTTKKKRYLLCLCIAAAGQCLVTSGDAIVSVLQHNNK